MKLEKIFKNHPTIVHAEDLKQICHPLKVLNISYFCHVKLNAQNQFSALGLHPQFAEHYLNQRYFNVDSHLSAIQLQEEYIIQDNITHTGLTKRLFTDCYAFGLHHLFTILQKNNTSIDAFHFASSSFNPAMNGKYLTYLPFLKNFILYFKENVFSNKQLAGAYQSQITLDSKSQGYQILLPDQKQIQTSLSIDAFAINKYYLPTLADNKYLTKREIECISYLRHGKTAEEIAQILGVTERTIRAHINHIKEKFSCATLYQLGEKIASAGLTEFYCHFRQ